MNLINHMFVKDYYFMFLNVEVVLMFLSIMHLIIIFLIFKNHLDSLNFLFNFYILLAVSLFIIKYLLFRYLIKYFHFFNFMFVFQNFNLINHIFAIDNY